MTFLTEHHTICINEECGKIFLGAAGKYCVGCELDMQRKEKYKKNLPSIQLAINKMSMQGETATDYVMGEETYDYLKPYVAHHKPTTDKPFVKMDCKYVGTYMHMDVYVSEGLKGDESFLFDRASLPANMR